MWSAVRVAFKRDRGHGYAWELGEPRLDRIVLRLSFGEPEAPPIVVDRNGDVIRIVEGSRRPIERGVIEIPLRRGALPDKLGKVSRVFFVAGPAALGGEVILVPPFELAFRRQRYAVQFLTADQIAAHGDERSTTLRPHCR